MTANRTPVFVIAEAGVNHDGSLEKALRLVEVAAEAGADAVKFQTFRTDEVTTRKALKADYQQRQTGSGGQYDMIRALELEEAAHEQIAAHCVALGIEFMSTPFSVWGIDLLVSLGMKRVKVASGELVNLPLLRAIASRKLPIILSTGMGTLAEVERAVGWIRDAWSTCNHSPSTGDLTVLHCTSDYPADPATANLRAMDTLADSLAVPVGYSDHTLGQAVSLAAVARGAVMIEKHFTIDPNDFGPDHAASLDPAGLRELIRAIRMVEMALGDGVKQPQPNEMKTRELVRRSAYAARPIRAGEVIDEESVSFLRPSGGIGPDQADRLFGAVAKRDIFEGDAIAEGDLA